MGIHADHLVELAGGGMVACEVLGEADAIPLMEVHGWIGDGGHTGKGREEGDERS
jgi:hypothetical protein